MDFEIHLNIPEDSKRGHLIATLVEKKKLSPQEAVESIIDSALQFKAPVVDRKRKTEIPGLPPEPLSDEDVAIVDEVLAIAMAARRERSEHLLGR